MERGARSTVWCQFEVSGPRFVRSVTSLKMLFKIYGLFYTFRLPFGLVWTRAPRARARHALANELSATAHKKALLRPRPPFTFYAYPYRTCCVHFLSRVSPGGCACAVTVLPCARHGARLRLASLAHYEARGCRRLA